ncbi:Clavaminate synthase-like protein [Choiromyces venosus 120613-1]|uniref:Clavaminate synthase-like protein n=1 Tax=Choiromyces venosus 120613-1 TaxID=1336337 RepID=A0A3N4JFX8_9PEZI|nr:Clavaminate synthase-like protein [Choiromyces venosus 120613-1]
MSSPVSLIPLADTQECAENLLQAAETLGFVYITLEGSDIPPEKVERMFEISKKFFASPKEEKAKYHISPDNRGWSSMHTEILDPEHQRRGDFKEAFNLGEFKDGKAQQPLPLALQDHESELNEFSDYCYNLCLKLLRLFGTALKINETEGGKEWFTSRHSRSEGPSGSILRLLFYPNISAHPDFDPKLDTRAGAHSDYGSITLLFQRPSEPGLEILHPYSKTWHPVPVVSNAILVNIGDLLSYWTAGLLRSTVHRVVTPDSGPEGPKDRYSMAFFCHPSYPTLLTPIPSEIIRSRGEGGANDAERTLTSLDHLKSRLSSAYGWKSDPA